MSEKPAERLDGGGHYDLHGGPPPVPAARTRTEIRTRVFFASVTALVGMALLPSPVYAYMGPGVGLSAIGALLSLVAAGVVSLLGFIWFPIKRAIWMLKSRRKHTALPRKD
jgi:hypothetical protein